jgi:Zn-dependent protease
MRRFRIPLGTVMGVRLWLHASWFLVAGLVLWATTEAFGEGFPGLPLAERLLMGAVTTVCFFASLVAHELAHSVVARRFGVRVRGITLFMLGGVAEIDGEIPTPAQEVAVALVGPAVSLALAAAFALLWGASIAIGWTWAEGIAFTVATVDLGVALFNLIPGLPLDGGRLLRAAIWRRSGDRDRATRIASGAGRALALLLVSAGVMTALAGDPVGLWYIPMGSFIFLMARSAGRVAPPVRTRALAWTDEPRIAGSRP